MFQILKIKTYLKFHFHLSSPIKLYLNIILMLHKNKKINNIIGRLKLEQGDTSANKIRKKWEI